MRLTCSGRPWLIRRWPAVSAIVFAAGLVVTAAGDVTVERLNGADKDPDNWLVYGGTYRSLRYSPLEQINAGKSYIPDVPDSDLGAEVKAGRLRATSDMSQLANMDVIDIAVPTPLRKTKDPDLSYVVKAVEACAATLRPGQLIVLESTTYPGTTDEVVQPMLEAKGLKADVDFLLALGDVASVGFGDLFEALSESLSGCMLLRVCE